MRACDSLIIIIQAFQKSQDQSSVTITLVLLVTSIATAFFFTSGMYEHLLTLAEECK